MIVKVYNVNHTTSLLEFHNTTKIFYIVISLFLLFDTWIVRVSMIYHTFILSKSLIRTYIVSMILGSNGKSLRLIRIFRFFHFHILTLIFPKGAFLQELIFLFQLLNSIFIFLQLKIMMIIFIFFIWFPHFIDNKLISQCFVLSLQPEYLLINFFSLLVQGLLFLTYFSVIILFNLLQTI